MANVTPTATFVKHALGLPAGSVRSMLAFCVLAYLWIIGLSSGVNDETKELTGLLAQKGAITAFIYMQLIMLLVICQYTVAHGKTIGKAVSHHHPLYMPRGVTRIILLVGYFGLAVWTFKNWSLKTTVANLNIEMIIIVLSAALGAFLIGHASTSIMRLFSGEKLPYWFLNFQAWFSLIALVLLAWVLLARWAINPSIKEEANILTLQYTEPAMACLVAFYYGARS